MESLEDSNCNSLSDSFSLYARYMRSFNVVDSLVEDSVNREPRDPISTTHYDADSSHSRGNIELSILPSVNVINKHCETAETDSSLLNTVCDIVDKGSNLDVDLCGKIDSPCTPLAVSLLENSSATERSLINEKPDPADVLVSSEEFIESKHPVFITPTMENSSNAVDSVPMFRDVRPTANLFKLPITELSFNGTLKHVQNLKPIVDPITALSSGNRLSLEEKSSEEFPALSSSNENIEFISEKNSNEALISDMSDNVSDRLDKELESTGDSQYAECKVKKSGYMSNDDGSITKWNLDQSYSSLEASFDSGVRSPDLFSDDDEVVQPEPFWSFLRDCESYDKKKVKKIEQALQGVPPPPSVTTLKTDVTEMLKKYYSFLPLFNEETKINVSEMNSMTPTKLVSFVEIPEQARVPECSKDSENSSKSCNVTKPKLSISSNSVCLEVDTSVHEKTKRLKMCTEIEARETLWPDVIKCRHYDVYYNVTKHSEKYELLALRYGERYVGAETDTSVNIYSGGLQSPSSASKRKALRLMMSQAKSPGRRLSHLARRRQAFCSAANFNDKAHSNVGKMVLIDKNFFPHRKLINSSERKSPRARRTPGKKTPQRKTPGKRTPNKTRSGGSSKKKAMRRLLMDTENMTRSQPSRETLKRALFISPEHRKSIPSVSSSVPLQAMKSKRALFSSPDRLAETKSMDGSQSDQFLKRKRDALDEEPECSRSKVAKSLSFGGDTIGSSQSLPLNRRASEVFAAKNTVQLNEIHKKKLLWAVSEALRAHGWRMSSAGFREKAGALARLTRRLLALPVYAARLAMPQLSTSDTMLKIARLYAYAIIQGRTIEECYQEEKTKLAKDNNTKISGYISAQAYQQMKARQASSTFTSQIKENTCDRLFKQEQPKSASKNILQDKLVNIECNSNSSSGLSMLDKASLGLFKSNSMPSFEEAAKMRARRQISFDNIDIPRR